MIENKMTRVENPADPRRCQAVFAHGQCPYLALDGSNFCPMHGGNKGAEVAQAKIRRQYNLAIWQDRVGEFAGSESVKSLREEIGILRLTLENMLTQCRTATDLLLFSSKIGELVGRIEKLVTSCNRLEASTGMLLDKSGALHLAAMMVDIIGKYVTDATAIDNISQEMAVAILNLNQKDLPE